MHKISVCAAAIAALGVAGCANTAPPPPPRPVYYVAPPPPGARRCMVWGEDMYGRRFCDRYYGY